VAEALYRKWRPSKFEDVVGQDHVSLTLKNQILTGRVGHAYLFVGSRGCGKTTSARILAKEINIAGLDDATARRIGDAISEGRALDVIEIDAASHTGVDAMREIIDKVRFQPSELKRKIYIIDEVHMLSTAAFNALLKTLEEPPPHVVFVLATTDPQKIPATVLSRCQRFTFKRVAVDKIVGRLRTLCTGEGIEADEHALRLIARHATGSLRDAVSLLDQAIAGRDIAAGLDAIQAAVDQGADARQIARQMIEHLRALMQIKVSRGDTKALADVSEAERIELAAQAEQTTLGALSRAVKAFSVSINEMRGTTDAQLPLEMAFMDCVVIADAAPATVVAAAPRPSAPRPQPAPAAIASTAAPVTPSAAPEPAAVAAPAAASMPAGNSDLGDALMSRWKDFVRETHKTNKPLAGLLNSCKPQGMIGNIAQLRADHDFAKGKLTAPETTAKLKQALSKWLGAPVEVNVFVQQNAQIDPADDPVLKAAKRLGAQVRQ
jgi:DNA polymerase III subunit gamma/tau